VKKEEWKEAVMPILRDYTSICFKELERKREREPLLTMTKLRIQYRKK